MKTIAINENLKTNRNNLSFKGHNVSLTDMGFKCHSFFTPYDNNKYDAHVEFQEYEEKNGDWVPTSKISKVPLKKDGILISDNDLFHGRKAIGYRFVFTDKENQDRKIYKTDSGVVSNPLVEDSRAHFSILLNNRSIMPENKLTKQVMPDLLPGFQLKYMEDGRHYLIYDKKIREKALNSVRTHGNKLDGNFAGIINMLPIWRKEGYTKIVGTPFTKDEVSSHLYWTENPYQVSSSLGTLDDFKTLQVELFKNGINFIADGAFVNQGLQGTMFKSVLKHGEKSPFFHWFKATGLKDGPLKLGALPKKPKARENFRFRVVNLPVKIVENNNKMSLVPNKQFDPKKPSYVQIYDKRMVRDREVNDANTLLTKYSILNTKNPYEITSHEDITQILTFEVNPKSYLERLQAQFGQSKERERNFNNNDFVENLLTFPYFIITTKDKGGVDLWDGNMDIAKLNFYIGNTDQKYINTFNNETDKKREIAKMREATYQVQDFTLKAGRYWTKLVADTQFEYVLNLFRNTKMDADSILEKIKFDVKKGNLPAKTLEVMNKEVIENILDGSYVKSVKNLEYADQDDEFLDLVCSIVLETPFASYPFSQDLSAVLISPYLTKYARDEKSFNLKRFEEFLLHYSQLKKMKKNEYYTPYEKMSEYLYNDVGTAIAVILNNVNKMQMASSSKVITHLPEVFEVTDFGHYMLPLLIPDITKYIIIKSLNPEAQVDIDEETGEFKFDEKAFSEISLKSLGISGSPEQEAIALVNRLIKGTKRFLSDEEMDKLTKIVHKRYKNLSLPKLQLAEAIIDRTGSGLGWRIDAAKDICNIDAARLKNDNPREILDTLSTFWGKFNDTVKSVNKNAYTTAEITDFDVILKQQYGDYKNEVDAETKFIERSGLNNTANYMFFFSLLRDMFAIDAEGGYKKGDFDNIKALRDKLIEGWEPKCHGFLYQYPDDSISNSYTFIGNHDKPRVLHVFALDMELFHSRFTDKKHVERAKKVLSYDENTKLDVYKLSSKAIAMGEKILDAFEDCAIDNPKLKKAVSQLASGNYKGEEFDADAFGVRDIRFAIRDVYDVAESLGYQAEDREEQIDKVLKYILTPAMDKMESVYKMLVTLPGSPTDFVGDKEGSTGYETKSNNVYQQNRNAVPFEWVNDALKIKEFSACEKGFVTDYYLRMNKIGNLRNIKELSALRNGDTIALPLQEGSAYITKENGEKIENIKLHDTSVAATFRYDDKGSQVICLYTTEGAQSVIDKKHNASQFSKINMKRPRVDLDKIVLSDVSDWKSGLKAGLKEGDIFKNVNDPNAQYKVCIEDGKYVLKNNDKYFTKISILPEDKNTAVFYKANAQKPALVPAQFVIVK